MKSLSIIITLTSLLTTALPSAVPRRVLPACTTTNNGATACSSLNSYGNDIFQCNNLRWTWVVRCHDPDTPCANGACVPSPPECSEGEKQCLTALNHGYDSINVCKSGKWETHDTCRCTDTPAPQCVAVSLSSRDDIPTRSCTEGVHKCMLRDEQGYGGALFVCRKGFWKTVMLCRASEHCFDDPRDIPTCSWREPS